MRKADFEGAKLVGVNLASVNLNGANFRNANLSKMEEIIAEIKDACFDDANLNDCKLWYTMTRCSLDRASLRGARIINLVKCSLVDVDLTKTRTRDAISSGNDFNGSDFTRAKMREMNFGTYGKYVTVVKAIFRDADLFKSNLSECDCHGSDFTGANLGHSKLVECNLRGTKFVNADLSCANLAKADLFRADLSGANLRKANLASANLSKAIVDGADFTGATIDGMITKGADMSKAVGIETTSRRAAGKIGKHLKKLDKLLRDNPNMTVDLIIALELPDEGLAVYNATGHGHTVGGGGRDRFHVRPCFREDGDLNSLPRVEDSFSGAIFTTTRPWADAKPRLELMKVETKNLATPAREFRAMLTAGFCEAFGLPIPSNKEFEEIEAAGVESFRRMRADLLGELARGKKGISRWNSRKYEIWFLASPFEKVDLVSKDLTGSRLINVAFNTADFDATTFADTRIWWAQFKAATFRDADFRKAFASKSRFHAAVFHNANFDDSSFQYCWFGKADFKGASLRETDLTGSNLAGADLSQAVLEDVNLRGVKFNEQTKFPSGFKLEANMKWTGKSPDPR
ncbi:MAG: pentapeptide repeat-containing protein [Planctomycetales bacterium]